MKIPACLVAALFVLLVCPSLVCSATPPPTAGEQQFAALGALKLQSGAEIHDLRLGYRTLGKLNAGKSNAVLWPSWLGGESKDLLQFVGTGKVVDDTQYFVVLVDAIGNGISTSPSTSQTQPPS